MDAQTPLEMGVVSPATANLQGRGTRDFFFSLTHTAGGGEVATTDGEEADLIVFISRVAELEGILSDSDSFNC